MNKKVLGAYAALMLVGVGLIGQVSSSTTFASVVARVGGRLIFISDSPVVARDDGQTLSYYGPISQVTPPKGITGKTTTLAANINNSVTSLTVASSAGFPATPFVASIGSEWVKVTTVAGTTWTISRAYDNAHGSGGAAASHTLGDTITELRWMWVNQGVATIDATKGSLYMTATATSGSHDAHIVKQLAPSGTWTVKYSVGGASPTRTGWDTLVGGVFRETSSGKLVTCNWETSSTLFAWHSSAVTWNDPVNPTAGVATDNYIQAGAADQPKLRMGDDGTNRYCDISHDGGTTWVNFYSASRTSGMTADEIGFFADSYQGATTPNYSASLTHWKVN